MLCVSVCVNAQNVAVSAIHSVTVIPSFNAYAKNYVEKKINDWQKKGEFEKTADWQVRVNASTRQKKIKEFTKEAEKIFISNIPKKALEFSLDGEYDADNEVFPVREKNYGVLLVKVPASEARAFKENFYVIEKVPTYYMESDNLALASVEFLLKGKIYKYSNKASLTYSTTNIEYNFEPIEINVASDSFDKGTQRISTNNITVGKSKVDVNIPETTIKNEKTFAFIIANENYDKLAKVQFALNDGMVFREYCIKTLGLPKENIQLYKNATYGEMLGAMNKLKALANAYEGDLKVIFYYAGHGAPQESTKNAYLLPVDAYGVVPEVCYSLDKLYKELDSLNAQSCVVFLDACFSGAERSGEMLASARGVAVKASVGFPLGNTVVFSAASADQTALAYQEMGHGMFTYFLLEKLQATRGDVTFEELGSYITTNVKQKSIVINNKLQTPTMVSGDYSDDWKSKKLCDD